MATLFTFAKSVSILSCPWSKRLRFPSDAYDSGEIFLKDGTRAVQVLSEDDFVSAAKFKQAKLQLKMGKKQVLCGKINEHEVYAQDVSDLLPFRSSYPDWCLSQKGNIDELRWNLELADTAAIQKNMAKQRKAAGHAANEQNCQLCRTNDRSPVVLVCCRCEETFDLECLRSCGLTDIRTEEEAIECSARWVCVLCEMEAPLWCEKLKRGRKYHLDDLMSLWEMHSLGLSGSYMASRFVCTYSECRRQIQILELAERTLGKCGYSDLIKNNDVPMWAFLNYEKFVQEVDQLKTSSTSPFSSSSGVENGNGFQKPRVMQSMGVPASISLSGTPESQDSVTRTDQKQQSKAAMTPSPAPLRLARSSLANTSAVCVTPAAFTAMSTTTSVTGKDAVVTNDAQATGTNLSSADATDQLVAAAAFGSTGDADIIVIGEEAPSVTLASPPPVTATQAEPVKRGRGRPRKNPVVTVATPGTTTPIAPVGFVTSEPMKKKRGRPRKDPLPTSAVEPSIPVKAQGGATISAQGDGETEGKRVRLEALADHQIHHVPSPAGNDVSSAALAHPLAMMPPASSFVSASSGSSSHNNNNNMNGTNALMSMSSAMTMTPMHELSPVSTIAFFIANHVGPEQMKTLLNLNIRMAQQELQAEHVAQQQQQHQELTMAMWSPSISNPQPSPAHQSLQYPQSQEVLPSLRRGVLEERIAAWSAAVALVDQEIKLNYRKQMLESEKEKRANLINQQQPQNQLQQQQHHQQSLPFLGMGMNSTYFHDDPNHHEQQH